MTNKSLKEVMDQPFLVMVIESGYEVKNGAGSAQYDEFGNRTIVCGIPEYFPLSISVTTSTHEILEPQTKKAFTIESGQVFFSETFILGPSPYLRPDWQSLNGCGVRKGGISGKSDD